MSTSDDSIQNQQLQVSGNQHHHHLHIHLLEKYSLDRDVCSLRSRIRHLFAPSIMNLTSTLEAHSEKARRQRDQRMLMVNRHMPFIWYPSLLLLQEPLLTLLLASHSYEWTLPRRRSIIIAHHSWYQEWNCVLLNISFPFDRNCSFSDEKTILILCPSILVAREKSQRSFPENVGGERVSWKHLKRFSVECLILLIDSVLCRYLCLIVMLLLAAHSEPGLWSLKMALCCWHLFPCEEPRIWSPTYS